MTTLEFRDDVRHFCDRAVFVSGMARAYNTLAFTYDEKQRRIAIETMQTMIEELNELLSHIAVVDEMILAFETLKSLERDWGRL